MLGQHHLGDGRVELPRQAIIQQLALLLLRNYLEDVGKLIAVFLRPSIASVSVNADFTGQTCDGGDFVTSRNPSAVGIIPSGLDDFWCVACRSSDFHSVSNLSALRRWPPLHDK